MSEDRGSAGAAGRSPAWVLRTMRLLGRLVRDRRGEMPLAVRVLGLAERWRRRSVGSWPPLDGAFVLGDASAPVAVCTLTGGVSLDALAALPGVAIAGRLMTPNLGVERMVRNVLANPAIRVLLVCGRESPIFWPGQALVALYGEGVDERRRIRGARGHVPVLRNLSGSEIAGFVGRVSLVDRIGEVDVEALQSEVEGLAARVGSDGTDAPADVIAAAPHGGHGAEGAGFKRLRSGGRRPDGESDPAGFFVIVVDPAAGEIVLRHYLPDRSPGHEVRSRSGEAIFRALLREGLVTRLDHAGYVGAELAKAEAALRLGRAYEQDRPLR